MQEEIFIKIRGYEEQYQISNYGQVYSLWKKKIRLQDTRKAKNDRKYQAILLVDKNGKKKKYSIARLVAEHFVPGRTKEKKYVNHIDNNPQNNNATNLEWCTQSHNVLHAYNNGYAKGKRTIQKQSKYRGVSWKKGHKKWEAKLYRNNKSYFVGYFDDDLIAYKAIKKYEQNRKS